MRNKVKRKTKKNGFAYRKNKNHDQAQKKFNNNATK